MSHLVKDDTCPVCETKLNAATNIDGELEPPKPHDVSICITCMALLEYDDDLSLHQINIKELEPEVQDVIAAAMIKLSMGRTFH